MYVYLVVGKVNFLKSKDFMRILKERMLENMTTTVQAPLFLSGTETNPSSGG
jgi:hypothetical protein